MVREQGGGVSPPNYVCVILPILRGLLRWRRLALSPFDGLFAVPFPWRQIRRSFGISTQSAARLLDELSASKEFRDHMDAALLRSRGTFAYLPLLYVLVRALRPAVLVETGVASGMSSAVILQAVRRNGLGHLWSIDLPDYDYTWVEALMVRGTGIPHRNMVDNTLPPGMKSGWAVPSDLRDVWTLLAGDTKTELPRLLGQISLVDFALHDSDHSEEAVLREGGLLGQRLRLGGVLVVDDVDMSRAFASLLKQAPWSSFAVFGRVGMARR
jgi:methyltransferase family protein